MAYKKIIVMSRQAEMYWHPNKFIPKLVKFHEPDRVHTIVCLTKFPAAIFEPPYGDVLAAYPQVFANITITGFGGSIMEPGVLPWRQAVSQLPELIKFVGDPQRVKLFIKPLMLVNHSDRYSTNIPIAEKIITESVKQGVKRFAVGFYTKTPDATKKAGEIHGINFEEVPEEKQIEITENLCMLATSYGATLSHCSFGLKDDPCINGKLIQELHPDKEICLHKENMVMKHAWYNDLCGCPVTEDIGSWIDMPCSPENQCKFCMWMTKHPDEPSDQYLKRPA